MSSRLPYSFPKLPTLRASKSVGSSSKLTTEAYLKNLNEYLSGATDSIVSNFLTALTSEIFSKIALVFKITEYSIFYIVKLTDKALKEIKTVLADYDDLPQSAKVIAQLIYVESDLSEEKKQDETEKQHKALIEDFKGALNFDNLDASNMKLLTVVENNLDINDVKSESKQTESESRYTTLMIRLFPRSVLLRESTDRFTVAPTALNNLVKISYLDSIGTISLAQCAALSTPQTQWNKVYYDLFSVLTKHN